jgi:AcrR family transcriptional regulator
VRAQATVDAILAAAAQVLVKQGYEGTNTNRIAEQAGVSVGSVYQYYPNKESIVVALMERHAGEIWGIFSRESSEVWNASIEVAVERVIGAVFSSHMLNPRLHQVLSEQVPRHGKLSKIRDVQTRMIEMTRAYLDTHKKAHDLADTQLAAFVVVHTVENLVHEGHEPGAPPLESLRDQAVRLVLRYLGVPRSS